MSARYQIATELDEGFAVPTNGGPIQEWRGIRVKYRKEGSRGRWHSFLLEFSEQPSLEDLQAVCAQHEARKRAAA